MTLAGKAFILFAFLLVVASVWTTHRARQHERQAEAMFPPEGQILQVDGHAVHAVVMGEGPDLVLIHGASGNARDFTHALAPALAADYRVIVFDRPGLGYTERINKTGATIRQQAGLFIKAAEQLGAKSPIVVGHSYGGAVALAWATYHPDRLSALVTLAGPGLPWTTPLSLYYRVLSHPFLGPLAIPVLTAYIHDERVEREVSDIFDPQTAPDGYLDHIGAGLTLRRDSLRANALQRANLLDEITEMAPHYPDIRVPTEIVHGDIDTIVGLDIHARPLAAIISGAKLTVLPGIGHMPQHAAQTEVIQAIHRAASRAGLR
ncbi:alpha/beta fold hydrolase [Shimia aestuarii]|uniref:Pimeloyl-ACP methyl ester carboxylesterase n=1 Tax=Shimia aestuarii TaxID=254406 RepID=A0A1I4NH36_9RHOB|nr:alpha/beta hydrolase [Shimia aestuarii]SFM14695.1 Pimeloyl-ACP methyl ester carboxylesterase [Shimia aestuarii]